MNEKKYSIEQVAKYVTVSLLGTLQEREDIAFSRDYAKSVYEAVKLDLQTGAMERSCQDFDNTNPIKHTYN
jgi:hypothetical protein